MGSRRAKGWGSRDTELRAQDDVGSHRGEADTAQRTQREVRVTEPGWALL